MEDPTRVGEALRLPKRRRQKPRLTVEQRIEQDNDRRQARELEMLRRQGFALFRCAVCQREGPWEVVVEPEGRVCDDCLDAIEGIEA